MGKECNHSDILLKRNGLDQNQRSLKALDPDSFQLHDLNIEDWMTFAHDFARYVNYFSTESNTVGGDWEQFFVQKDKIEDLLSNAKINKDLNPHLALFTCFLSLIEFSQKRLNKLSSRHLDFYYKKVLKLENKAATPDKVHVLFELAKNASELLVKEGTALDAGKDAIGNKRIYKTEGEIVVNSAQIAALKNVYHDQGEDIKYSDIANSGDGLGGDFPDDAVKWWPFGHPDFDEEDGVPNLPSAKLGFAIASPILLLKEGSRTITFTLVFDKSIKEIFSNAELDDALEILCSGEKEWIPAIVKVGNSFTSLSGNKLKLTVELTEGAEAIVPYNKEVLLENFSSTNPIARFLFKRAADGTANNPGYKLYSILKSYKLTKVTIDVQVAQMQEMILENDLGRLDVSKPFLPFGPQPVKGSKFYIGCQEALNKPWTKLSVDLQWKDTPFYAEEVENFVEHYIAYRNDHLIKLGKDTYSLSTSNYTDTTLDNGLIVNNDADFKVSIETLNNKTWEPRTAENGGVLFEKDGEVYGSSLVISQPKGAKNAQAARTSFSRTSKAQFLKSISSSAKAGFLFNSRRSAKGANSAILGDVGALLGHSFFDLKENIMGGTKVLFEDPIQQENFSSTAKKGFIRLSLEQPFLHDLFPKVYGVALSKFEDSSRAPFSALVPNEPYTPLVETIRIGYEATVSKSFNLDASEANLKGNLSDYLDESIELFHEHPFGQSEEHTYLKMKHNFLEEKSCKLVPDYDQGELYIALENSEQLQQVSLLVQVLEGSENPEYEGVETYQDNEKLEWFILSNDEWKPLNKDFIVFNSTDNFLKSGIVRLSIPREATRDNNRLPGDFFWLKVLNIKKFDTVCQAVSLHTQAETAVFDNNNNEVSHLATGLPAGTISKLVERIATLKGVAQPHNSSDGIPKETDAQLYRRVSERLRHKQRVITIWDYESLILQFFPKVYKVNCLKHTSKESELAPGAVTVIVIPNIIDQNVFDIYKPRLSKAKRNEIQAFINGLNTLHVDALVENPNYQEIKVVLMVKFHEGKDQNFYSKELKKDIAKFLSPWAYEETAAINFGITLHKSAIIFYIEKLGYVDYIKNVELQIETERIDVQGNIVFEAVEMVIPKDSRTILTSVKYDEHEVIPISVEECAKV